MNENEKLIEDLHAIISEISARELTSNCPDKRLRHVSYYTLCEMAIEILQALEDDFISM